MKTELTTDPERAAAVIRRGGLAAFPTETVYGLGANALDESAVRRIFAAKQRPADNPLIHHVGAVEEVRTVAKHIPSSAHSLITHFFPGPLTIVVPRAECIPTAATAGLDTVGIRMPDHPLALSFLQAAGCPVAAPSANRSGRPSPTDWRAVRDDLDGRIDCILQGTATRVGVESTVVDCCGEVPVVLRAGGISLEQLRGVVPEIQLVAGRDEALRRSPGTRHRHYAPTIPVVLIDDPAEIQVAGEAAYIGLTRPQPADAFVVTCLCPDVTLYARRLFAFFRESERRGARRIYCQRVDEAGLGAALMDRLARAAAGTASSKSER